MQACDFAEDAGCGRGLRTARPVGAGQPVVQVPWDVVLSIDTALRSRHAPAGVRWLRKWRKQCIEVFPSFLGEIIMQSLCSSELFFHLGHYRDVFHFFLISSF